MSTRCLVPAEALPRGLRAVLNWLIILGVFAMHNVLVGADGQTQSHHDSMSMSQIGDAAEETAHMSAVVVASVVHAAELPDTGGAMSDCGGLMALCLAMVVTVSALLVVRQVSRDRVLWQLPPPTAVRAFAPIPPFNCRSPLQRSSVLRC
ncbi:hypothetical protein [Aeromicrobium sp.]|uniref:hypothetical protein n=1 Tax=Aeromicrobium sp. TaxID=1871063 RepID=UPI0030C2F97D